MKAINSNDFKVKKYLEIYQDFLHDNNLSDDSADISVTSLVDFVENHIPIDGYEFQ